MTTVTANAILMDWNKLSLDDAAEEILPCNGSPVWATLLAYRRPFASPDVLFAAADDVWRSLPEEDWQEAFDSHPRIGEQSATSATGKSLSWSAGEQAAATLDEQTQEELAAANRQYESRFRRIFIVCATGRSAGEILDILHGRLNNDEQTELLETAEQQRQITQLRLRKWLQMPMVNQ